MTAILIDTHIFLWMRTSPLRLSDRERDAIKTASARYVSIVSLWETGIRISLRRVVAADDRFFLVPTGFELLTILPEHCAAVSSLPQRHRDPFDRMLIAQAKTENLVLITRDRAVAAYRSAGLSVLPRSTR
jgi:PIN domain nuclease of toxin-antitoxin system